MIITAKTRTGQRQVLQATARSGSKKTEDDCSWPLNAPLLKPNTIPMNTAVPEAATLKWSTSPSILKAILHHSTSFLPHYFKHCTIPNSTSMISHLRFHPKIYYFTSHLLKYAQPPAFCGLKDILWKYLFIRKKI